MILQHFLHSVFTTLIYELSNLFLTEHIIGAYEEYGLVGCKFRDSLQYWMNSIFRAEGQT
jgi:hypothetical protein